VLKDESLEVVVLVDQLGGEDLAAVLMRISISIISFLIESYET
jgi:hypothetical protein